ncbi:MAG: Rieske 2Fe-2S domain-containing protein [Candidatus Dormibacteraeota bacterium]|nr:Rieske 2Fe-2S domain-containing protein [Candidatus Dormibacteraeota bacterium]
MTRRNFIVWWIGGLMGAIGVVIVAPLLLYIFPPGGAGQKKNIKVTLQGSIGALKTGDGISFDAPKETGFVMKDGGGDNFPGKISFKGYIVKAESGLLVLSATCSHLGCSINLVAGQNQFACPCHGSKFNLGGAVTHGPATAPLSHYDWKQLSDTTIQVLGVPTPGVG